MKYNQTLLNAYGCPYRGHRLAEAISHEKPLPQSSAALLGSVLHHHFAEYIQGRLPDEAPALPPELQDDFQEVFQRFFNKWNMEKHPDDYAPVLEYHLEAELQGYQLHGTPDLIDAYPDRVLIRDWKTQRRLPPLSEVMDWIQLPYYALLYSLVHGMPARFDMGYLFVRYQTERTFTMLPDQVVQFGVRIIRRIKQIESWTAWPAQPGSACDYCEVTLECPALTDLGLSADRVQNAERLRALEVAMAEHKKWLKADVERNGPVKVGNESLGFFPHLKKSFEDVPAVVDALLGADVPREEVWKALSLTQANAKRLCAGNQDLKKRIEAMLSEKTETWFEFS